MTVSGAIPTSLSHHTVLFGCKGAAFREILPERLALPDSQWDCGEEMAMPGCRAVLEGTDAASSGSSLPTGAGL